MAVQFSIDWDVPRKGPDPGPDAAKHAAIRAEQIRLLKKRRWVYRVLALLPILLFAGFILYTQWESRSFVFSRQWSNFSALWMMPFLAWGCFVRSRWLRVLAIGALAGECLDGTILFSSQLSSLYRNFARLNWDLMICYIFLFLALHPVGLFAAIRLYLLELRLYPWEAVPPTVSPLPTYSELAAASPPDSPADRAAWAASASGATAPSAESGRALLFKRLAPWLALLPVLLQAMYVIWLRIDQLVKMVSFDTALSLVLFTALGIGALLAARGQPRWRLWACGVAGWFAVVLFMRNGSMFMMIDSEATYQFFDWADAHGRYNRAWNLFWCLAMAVGLRAIFWLVPRDFAAVGAEGAGGAAVEPEDTVAENTHWDESGPGKKQEG